MFAFLLNTTLSPITAALAVNQAQQYASEDAMLICTGSKIKWISQSTFEQRGVVMEVEAPTDAPEGLHQLDCSFSFLVDNLLEPFSLIKMVDEYLAYQDVIADLFQRPYTSFAYLKGQTRAPPQL